MFIHFVDWLEKRMLACPSRKYFNVECPGCGFQRSCIALLKGNWLNSWHLYPATLPLLAVFIFTMLHLKFKFKNGATAIKWLQIFAGSIILISYCIKIFNHQIFV